MDQYKTRTYLVLLCSVSILLCCASAYVLWFSIQARNEAFNSATVFSHVASGQLLLEPYMQTLAATSPLAMTLPVDLTPGRVYHVWSTTAVAHTITSTTPWDGVNSVVTLGGAIGDGLVFAVTDSNRIVIETSKNIVLS